MLELSINKNQIWLIKELSPKIINMVGQKIYHILKPEFGNAVSVIYVVGENLCHD